MADDKNVFGGDVLLVDTRDGADIVVEDGLVKDCRNFDTAVYLSLFGGNRADLDGRPTETWWGNLVPGTDKNGWMHSEFGAMAAGLPLTGANLRKAADAAARDLDWLKRESGADGVSVSLQAESAHRVRLVAEITEGGRLAGGGAYEIQWQEAVR